VKRVTGSGGIFFTSDNPDALYDWYEKHLGMQRSKTAQAVEFEWMEPGEPSRTATTAWALFPRDTTYFKDSRSPFMINYRVEDLDGLLEQLRNEGVTIDPQRENYEFGRFAWITDLDGNRIELWEPPKGKS